MHLKAHQFITMLFNTFDLKFQNLNARGRRLSTNNQNIASFSTDTSSNKVDKISD